MFLVPNLNALMYCKRTIFLIWFCTDIMELCILKPSLPCLKYLICHGVGGRIIAVLFTLGAFSFSEGKEQILQFFYSAFYPKLLTFLSFAKFNLNFLNLDGFFWEKTPCFFTFSANSSTDLTLYMSISAIADSSLCLNPSIFPKESELA